MPNAFAFLTLLAWPLASVMLFRLLPAGRALIASLLIAHMFLPPPPALFDLPLLPPLDKYGISTLTLMAVCLVLFKDWTRFLPTSRIALVLVAVYVFSPVITVLTNPEPAFYGRYALPGLRLREVPAQIIQQAINVAPLLMTRALLVTARDLRDVVFGFFLAGLVYSLPMLVEVRLSPQLNVWFYGFFQHSFEQMVRDGGFRPIVFLYHGLWAAFFAMTALVCTVALARHEPGRAKVVYVVCAAYLAVVLVLCKSLGSILFALMAVPLVFVMGRRLILTAAAVLALLSVVYPSLKGSGIVPSEEILALVETINPERAFSLQVRFENEDILVERAFEKPVFGWGLWGRNHILDDNGTILTITDGRWIIVLGVFGWVGFLAEFLLLTMPVFLLWRKSLAGDAEELSPYAVTLALLLSINMVDLIPNATIMPLTWMMAGAVLGYAERYAPKARVRPPAFQTVL